jgi:3D (Asp-Asp-Asp) domain-containing protein
VVSVSENVGNRAENETINTVEQSVVEEYVITAYCPCVKCCGIWSEQHPSRVGTDYKQKTASGTFPKEGRTIAVDPSIIDYGTEIIIDGNTYIAEDKGGAIKGKKIDIFFESHQSAIEWGRQTKQIEILN